MPWKRRGNREYYYKSRRVGGRVLSEYFGPGTLGLAVAMLDAEAREEREESRAEDREVVAELARLDAAIGRVFDGAMGRFRAFMRAAGFRQHKRGEWRLPRGAAMTTEVATTADAPTPPAVPGGRKVFGRRMELGALNALMARLGGKPNEKHQDFGKLRKDVESLAADLAGGPDAPAAVQALANAAALSWGEWLILALCDHATTGRSIAQAEHASRIADRAHRRYVRSVKALAEIRKAEGRINVIARNVQVNVERAGP